jgi:hypothetical protein
MRQPRSLQVREPRDDTKIGNLHNTLADGGTPLARKPQSKIGLASPFWCGQDGGVLLIDVEV